MAKHHAAFMQRLRHLEPREHAEDAVEAAAADHGIAMRAGDERRKPGFRAFAPAGQVAGRIGMHCEPCLLELLAQPLPGLVEFGREGAAGPRDIGKGEGGKSFEAMPEAISLDGNGWGHPPMFAEPG